MTLCRVLGGPGHVFALDHHYVEVVYGPILGPAATLLARALDRKLREAPEVAVDLRLLAHEVGLRAGPDGEPLGRKSSLVKALDRLQHHGVVRATGSTLEVVDAVAPLPSRLLDRLPPSARAAHVLFLAVPPQ